MAGSSETTSKWSGNKLKFLSLFILVLQNSSLVLIMRFSRIIPGPRYLTSTAVLLSEILKGTICLIVHLSQKGSQSPDRPTSAVSETSTIRQTFAEICGHNSGYMKMLIPAVLYTLQNNLQFVAASNLDAATFQVTYQFKILTTAFFAVILLRQSLSARKWISLFLLTAGVACVQIPSSSSVAAQGNWTLGVMAVAVACVLSGGAGVYFEKILKVNTASLWLRNIQLCSASLVIAGIGAMVWDGKAIREGGFFQGYNSIVVATIVIQAMGGLIVAIVIKYADNILKGFATSLSIILSTTASTYLFDFVVTRYFLMGSVLVCLATYLYGLPDEKRTTMEPLVVEKENEEER